MPERYTAPLDVDINPRDHLSRQVLIIVNGGTVQVDYNSPEHQAAKAQASQTPEDE